MSVGAVNKNTGERIPTAGMPAIDNALSATSTNPVQNAIITAALANKQDKTDNALQTTDKTVVGAINEHEGDISSLKSGLTNVDSGYLSKQFVIINGTSIYDFVRNANTPTGYIVADIQGATDNPEPNTTSFAVIYKPLANGNFSIVKVEKGNQLFISNVLLPTDIAYTFTEFAKNSRLVCTEIVYDDSASLFTLPSGVPKPKDGAQIMVCGRNRSTGAIYALWFDNSASGFKIGKILDGSAPADGTSISVQYIA